MQIEYYEYFMAIASGMSFQDASSNFHISPSSMTKAIQSLEKNLDVNLFDRSFKKKITISPAGKALYSELQSLIPAYKLMLQNLKNFKQSQIIKCCYCAPLPDIIFNDFMSEFKKENTDVRITTRGVRFFDAAIKLLRDNVCDFVITHKPIGTFHDCIVTELYSDRFMIVLPKNHPFASLKSIPLSALNGERILLSTVYHSLFIDISQYFENSPTVEETPLGSLSLLQLINAGKCITFFYEHEIINFVTSDIVVRPINELSYTPVVLISSKQREMTYSQRLMRNYFVNKYKELGWTL